MGQTACALHVVDLLRFYALACRVQLASVQFHLLNTGIVFLSREGLKRGCQRIQKVLSLFERLYASICFPCLQSCTCLPTATAQNNAMHSKMLLIVQDESVHIQKVLALASLCIPLGACITLAACLATLWRSNLEEADANAHVMAVVMQGKVCCPAMSSVV